MRWDSPQVVLERLNRLWVSHPEKFQQLKEMGELFRQEVDPHCFLYEAIACAYGVGNEVPHSARELAKEYGMPIKKVHFYRKVALWILGEKPKDFLNRSVAGSVERVQRFYEQWQKEKEVKKMPKFGEVARVVPSEAGEKEKQKIEMAPKRADLFEAFMVEAKPAIDGTYEISGLMGIAERMGIKGASNYIKEFKKMDLLGLKKTAAYPDGKGRYGVYWIKMVDVGVKARRKPSAPKQKMPQAQLPPDALAALVKWLEKELPKAEKEVAAAQEQLVAARERLRRFRVARDVIAILTESPILKGGDWRS